MSDTFHSAQPRSFAPPRALTGGPAPSPAARETVEQMAERTGLPIEILNARVTFTPSPAAEPPEGLLCDYGHVKADHDAAGACVRPSPDARVAAAAAYPDPIRVAVRIAFERGWDAHTAAIAPLLDRAAKAEAAVERLEWISQFAPEAIREVHQADATEPHACDWCGQGWPCDAIRALDDPKP